MYVFLPNNKFYASFLAAVHRRSLPLQMLFRIMVVYNFMFPFFLTTDAVCVQRACLAGILSVRDNSTVRLTSGQSLETHVMVAFNRSLDQ